MVGFFAIRVDSPSVSFFFARLSVFLESLGGQHPQVGLFMSRDCALRLVLLKVHPLICHSLIQYHLVSEMVEEMVMGVGIRSSELNMGLSSSDNPMGMEVDTTMSKPFSSSSKKPFHALVEKCVLEEKHMRRFR